MSTALNRFMLGNEICMSKLLFFVQQSRCSKPWIKNRNHHKVKGSVPLPYWVTCACANLRFIERIFVSLKPYCPVCSRIQEVIPCHSNKMPSHWYKSSTDDQRSLVGSPCQMSLVESPWSSFTPHPRKELGSFNQPRRLDRKELSLTLTNR